MTDLPGFMSCFRSLFGSKHDFSMSWVALHSKKGCQQQGAHCDYMVGGPNWSKNSSRVSHGCLVSIEDDTKFDVWPGAHHLLDGSGFTNDTFHFPISRQTELLKKGDIVFFRADCFHAGSEYLDKTNTRLHCYLDVRSMPHPINRVVRYHTFFNEGVLSDT